jgi:hypothetical protein
VDARFAQHPFATPHQEQQANNSAEGNRRATAAAFAARPAMVPSRKLKQTSSKKVAAKKHLRSSYSIQEKLEIVKFAKKVMVGATAACVG